MVSWASQYLVLQSVTRNILFIVALFSIVGYFQLRFDDEHTELPEGCDEFGYLQLADQLANNQVGTQPHFIKKLVEHLEVQGFEYRDYAWMIAPHAHHWHSETQQIINQYPPATSWLLSWFSKENRQLLFPGIMGIISLIPLLALGLSRFNQMHQQLLLVFSFGCLAFYPPTSIELSRINSLAPTFGFLIAAGIAFKSNRWLSALFASISLIFRSANAVFIGPLWLFIFLFERRFDRKSIGSFALQSVLLFSGLVPTIMYQKWLLNDFTASTYSVIDQSFSDIYQLGEHLRFYFVKEPYWVFPMILVLILFLALNKNGHKKTLLSLGAAWFVLIVFFLFHEVKIYYYPYSAVLFGGGMLLKVVSDYLKRFNSFKWAPAIYIIVPLVVLSKLEPVPTLESEDNYSSCFTNEVVWSELRSGTVEYTTHAQGFRWGWGNNKARDTIIKWLAKEGERQLIWLNDLDVDENELKENIRRLGLNSSKKECELGELIVIEHEN